MYIILTHALLVFIVHVPLLFLAIAEVSSFAAGLIEVLILILSIDSQDCREREREREGGREGEREKGRETEIENEMYYEIHNNYYDDSRLPFLHFTLN